MQHSSIPTCYFPSTTLFLDDSRDFLLNFVLQLDEGVAYRIFDAPSRALDYIHNKTCEFDLLSRSRAGQVENRHLSATKSAKLELAAIHAEVYNPHRFSEVSVVVVDYAMPGMDGLEFCRRIENNNIKKILLTGQADEKLAIAAFNEGLIHRYIKKSDANASELITRSIYELQLQYFQAMSEMIVRMLSISSPSALYDKTFTQFFRQLCAEKNIVEYYLADKSGSFFMLDEDANTSFLIVKSEEDIHSYHQLALENNADADVLQQLAHGEKIPAFWLTQPLSQPWSEVVNCLVPAKCLIGNENYHYVYLEGNDLFDVRQQKILSYHRYLEELDAEELLVS